VAPHTVVVKSKEAAEIKDRFLTIWVRSRISVDDHERMSIAEKIQDYINFNQKGDEEGKAA